MKRSNKYEVVYSKRSFPAIQWAKSEDEAKTVAERLRSVGYGVDVWAFSGTKAALTKI